MIRITQEYNNLNQKNGVIKKQSSYSLMCDETEDHAEEKNLLLCFSVPFLELTRISSDPDSDPFP